METLTKKIRIIKGSGTRVSVDLDRLANFPQVIMPPKFKVPEFVKYDGTGVLAPICACFVGRGHHIKTIILYSAKFSLIA